MRRWVGIATVVMLLIPVVAVAAPAWQQDLEARVQALEARVAELEALHSTTTTAPSTTSTTAATTSTTQGTTTTSTTTTSTSPTSSTTTSVPDSTTTTTSAPTTTTSSSTTTTSSTPTTTTTTANTTTTAPDTDEINLQGDWAIPGHDTRTGFTVNGNGHQILISGTVDWDDCTIDNVSRVMFHDGAGPSELTNCVVSDSGVTGELGFYPLHWHLNGDSTRGTVVDNVTVLRGQNHAFVPHGSHGITIRNSKALNTDGDPFWWDPPAFPNDQTANPPCSGWPRFCTFHNSNDIVWENNLVDGVTDSTSSLNYRLTGFFLGAGSGNVANNNLVRNVDDGVQCSGYHWPEAANQNEGGTAWEFIGNRVEPNPDCVGIFVWQNGRLHHHDIQNFAGDEIDHGAYSNDYRYVNVDVPYFTLHASGVVIEDSQIGTLETVKHQSTKYPTLVVNDTPLGRFVVNNGHDNGEKLGVYELNNTGLSCADIEYDAVVSGTRVFVDGVEC